MNRKGFTLVELVIACAIFSLVMGLIVSGFRLMAGYQRQDSAAYMEHEAEVAMYLIVRDIRNARNISVTLADPGSMTLQTYNTDGPSGYDVAVNNFFQAAAISTVTYQYVTEGNTTSLLRKKTTNGVTSEHRMLKNILTPPTASNYLFRPHDGIVMDPIEGVDIFIRFSNKWYTGSQDTYAATSMRRTYAHY